MTTSQHQPQRKVLIQASQKAAFPEELQQQVLWLREALVDSDKMREALENSEKRQAMQYLALLCPPLSVMNCLYLTVCPYLPI